MKYVAYVSYWSVNKLFPFNKQYTLNYGIITMRKMKKNE